mgnify:CR=1 FL=1
MASGAAVGAATKAGGFVSAKLDSAKEKVSGMMASAPAAADGAKSDVWFSLMKARVVHDGAWVSTDPVDASKGVPLTLHGAGPKDTFGGVFELVFARHAIPSLAVADAIGDYDKSALVSSTLDIWRAWAANVEISIGFDKLSIKKAA